MDEVPLSDFPWLTFRALPWHTPRGCWDEPDELEALNGGVEVETVDLLGSCPSFSGHFSLLSVMTASIIELRRRWSHRLVTVGTPAGPDCVLTDALWECDTTRLWPVIGPCEFLREVRFAVEEVRQFPESRPGWLRPAARMRTLYLCQHEIRGD